MDMGEVLVYTNYLVVVFDKGSNVTPATVSRLVENIARHHFKDQPFGLISHRKNTYDVDPNVLTELREMDNLLAYAIVSKHEVHMHNFNVEKLFYQKEIAFFIEFDNALNWIQSHLSYLNNQNLSG